jgi:hypothetical protein
VTIELFSSYLGIGHGTKLKVKRQINNNGSDLKNTSTPEILSQENEGAATEATPHSKESSKMKAKKNIVMGKDSEAERHNPSRTTKSKADQKSGDDDIDRTGIKSIMKAAAAVSYLSGPAKRKAAAAAMAPKKTKVKKPGPQTDDQTFWKRFTELCQYKADCGTMRVPQICGACHIS